MDLDSALYKVREEGYGPDYRHHLLEQYKLYVEMADRSSARRQTANAFFLSVHTALLAVLGVAVKEQPPAALALWFLVVSVPGLLLAFVWYRLVRSYKDMNSGKFRVIHRLEARLPAAPYDAEWVSLGEGKDAKLYLPFTHVEMWVPRILGLLYLALAVWGVVAVVVDP